MCVCVCVGGVCVCVCVWCVCMRLWCVCVCICVCACVCVCAQRLVELLRDPFNYSCDHDMFNTDTFMAATERTTFLNLRCGWHFTADPMEGVLVYILIYHVYLLYISYTHTHTHTHTSKYINYYYYSCCAESERGDREGRT